MKRPELNEILIPRSLNGKVVITMSPGQWDYILEGAYETGWVLLEIENEQPVRAYQRNGR